MGEKVRPFFRKSVLLRGAAIALLLLAAASFILAPDSLLYRLGAIIAIMYGVDLNRRSRECVTMLPAGVSVVPRAPRVHHLLVGVALLVATGMSFYWLCRDALSGYNQVAPVIVFAIAGLVSSVYCAGVLARFMGGGS